MNILASITNVIVLTQCSLLLIFPKSRLDQNQLRASNLQDNLIHSQAPTHGFIQARDPASIIQLLDNFHNYAVILVLLQATDHNNSNNTFDARDSDRDSPTMNRIFPRTIAQPVLFSKGNLITPKFAVHIPCTASPSQHGLPFPRHPTIIIWHYSRVCTCVEKCLILVCERYIDHHRRRYRQEAIA
jgi:hypothetical protein